MTAAQKRPQTRHNLSTTPSGQTAASPRLHDMLEQLEIDARREAQRLEDAGRLSYGFTAHYYPLTKREEAAGRRARACWLLATDLDSLRALLKGARVPAHKLNQRYLRMHEERTR